MRRILSYLVTASVALPLVLSCSGKKAKIIPRSDMAHIYAEIYLLDEELRDCSWKLRRMADTSAVYEAIFEKYGYNKYDFMASQDEYIKDAERYSRIFKKSVGILQDELKELRKTKARLDKEREKYDVIDRFRPERIFFLSGISNPDLMTSDSLSFFVDSTGGFWTFDPQKGRDTVFAGPKVLVDTTAKHIRDSLKCCDLMK